LIGGAISVEDLELCGGTMTDLSPLSGLQQLRSLAISVASRLRSLDGVEGLASLEYFSAWHCAALHDLEVLTLHNVRVRDRDLRPLHGLPKLTRLELPAHFPAAEFDALAAALPAVVGRWRLLGKVGGR
jgi:hypothetical protein